MAPEEFDYVVVGSGTGSVVAARLAEDGRNSVCLLEAGPSDADNLAVLDVRRWPELLGTELDYDYVIEPQGCGAASMRQASARVLGGSTSHNACVAFRVPDPDLEAWERSGARGWGAAACRPYFQRLTERMIFQHSHSSNPLLVAFLAAAVQAGLKRTSFDLTAQDVEDAVGWTLLSTKGSSRQSSSVAYLHPLASLPSNLTLRCNTIVTRILFDGERRAIGVTTTHGEIRAAEEVILAAGAFESPKLLLLSGVGPAAQLRNHGIDVLVDLPGVGEHLLDHTDTALMWEASQPFERSTMIETAALFRSDREQEVSDILSFCVPSTHADMSWLPEEGSRISGAADIPEHAFCLHISPSRPLSTGWVRLRSPNPFDAPMIDPRYFSDRDGHDERTLVAGLRRGREIAAQPALREWVKREIAPGHHVETDEQLSAFGRLTSVTGHHPCGTCKMGDPGDPTTVVDPELRVRGVERLRVADASVFPLMIAVNTNITCMMIGERCARLVRGGGTEA